MSAVKTFRECCTARAESILTELLLIHSTNNNYLANSKNNSLLTFQFFFFLIHVFIVTHFFKFISSTIQCPVNTYSLLLTAPMHYVKVISNNQDSKFNIFASYIFILITSFSSIFIVVFFQVPLNCSVVCLHWI